jgi:hypothetical protein
MTDFRITIKRIVKFRNRYFNITLGLNLTNIPEAPELTNDKHVDHAYDCIRSFEL